MDRATGRRAREVGRSPISSPLLHARSNIWSGYGRHAYTGQLYDLTGRCSGLEPFWGSSPALHAGTWPPQKLDNTFGPRAVYEKGCSKEQGDNLAPCFGLQFFGHVAIDGLTEVMTVTLKDVDDHDLWSTRIEPQPELWSGRTAAIGG